MTRVLALAALALAGAAAQARADASATATTTAYVAKKDRDLADKRARAAIATPPKVKVGAKPEPLINLQHRWTDEWLAISASAPAPNPTLIDRLLRDHYTNAGTRMASKLVPTVLAAARHFGATRVEIVSGYRHPKYNLILRKKGHEVARDSQHSHGTAVDFRLPGISAAQLTKWAQAKRLGGVGTYLTSNFIHIDTGPVRTWSGE